MMHGYIADSSLLETPMIELFRVWLVMLECITQRCRALRLRFGMVSFRQPRTSSSGRRVRRRNSTMIASSAGVSTVLSGFGPMGASVVATRLRHFRTVLTLRPYWLARRRAGAFAAL